MRVEGVGLKYLLEIHLQQTMKEGWLYILYV